MSDIEQLNRIAFIQCQAVCATAQIEGMKAANAERKFRGDPPKYSEADFLSVEHEFMISHNAVLEYLRN